jgi:tight adherence protein B
MAAVLAAVTVAGAVMTLVPDVPRRLPRELDAGTRPGATTVPDRVRCAADRWLPGRRAARRDRQLPDALDRLASALRAGERVGPALVALAPQLPDPLGVELRAVARAVEHGTSLGAALEAWNANPTASRDVRLTTAALTIGSGEGGEVARAVDGVAATLRERHELRAELQALATQARASAGVLAAAPLAFAVLVAAVEPGAVLFLLTSPIGVACLLGGLALDAVGVVWMARITRRAG